MLFRSRLVFDLGVTLPLRTERMENGLQILIGEGSQEPVPPPALAEAPKDQPPTARRPGPPALAKRPRPERKRLPLKEAPKMAEMLAPPAPPGQQLPQGQPTIPPTSGRLSLDFKGADLDDLLRLISEVSGLNIVAAHGLQDRKGRDVTIRLINVEWRQALDIILRTKNLSYEQDGNLIYVGSKSEIQKAKLERAEDIRKVEEARKKFDQEARLKEIQIEEEKRKAEEEKRKAEEERIKVDRKSTRLNSSHIQKSRMPSSA